MDGILAAFRLKSIRDSAYEDMAALGMSRRALCGADRPSVVRKGRRSGQSGNRRRPHHVVEIGGGRTPLAYRVTRMCPDEYGIGGGSMRRLLVLVALVITVGALSAAPALAHVHGITPLPGCSVEPANAGANQTNETPAAAANGGPITGLIPRDVGNAPLTVGDGGSGAATGNCP